MEQDRLPCVPDQDLDRAHFERVWRRVMPRDRPDCPFTLDDPAPSPSGRLMPPEGDAPAPLLPAMAPLSLPAPTPMPPTSVAEDALLGPHLAEHGELLQGMIADKLTDTATYRAMARRTTGATAKALSTLSGRKRGHAKRLSVAYFLISGVRYWPDKLPGAPMSTFFGGVRERYLAEQAGALAYRSAAVRVGNAALRELFLTLAAEETAHARLLQGLLEQV